MDDPSVRRQRQEKSEALLTQIAGQDKSANAMRYVKGFQIETQVIG